MNENLGAAKTAALPRVLSPRHFCIAPAPWPSWALLRRDFRHLYHSGNQSAFRRYFRHYLCLHHGGRRFSLPLCLSCFTRALSLWPQAQSKSFLTEPMITEMNAVGGVLIMGIGINLLEIKSLRLGNLIPAIFIPFCCSGSWAALDFL